MFDVELNKGQRKIVDESMEFFRDPSRQVFQYVGGPGTGKSFLQKYIMERNRIPMNRIASMSYTGAAAINQRLNGFSNAKTINSWLYNPIDVEMKDYKTGQIVYDTYYNRPKTELGFEPKRRLDGILTMFIDEAYTVPYYMKKDILKHNIKIVASGDPFQLPPIDDKPAFLVDGEIFELNEVMRQDEGSNIINLAYRIRKGLPIQYGYYGDCWVIDEDDLTTEMIMRSDVFICGTNKKRDEINKRVREYKGLYTDLPCRGEFVICRKNNYRIESDGINLANGLRGVVLNNPDISGFDGNTFKINFKPFLFNGIFQDIRCNYKYFIAPSEMKDKIKKNKYTEGNLVEFAYAITTHLSQGCTVNNAIYYEEYLSPEINDRLNYVGATRPRHGLIYVKRRRKFYPTRMKGTDIFS